MVGSGSGKKREKLRTLIVRLFLFFVLPRFPLSLGKVVERFVRKSRKDVERSTEAAKAEAAANTTALFQTAAELYSERRYRVVPTTGGD